MQSALERTGTAIYVMDNNSNYVDREEIIGFDALYDSMMKSKKGVTWKGSVAHYVLNSMEETYKLSEELEKGTYKARPTTQFKITSPKPRDIISTCFRDRVYQRSLNDNALYPIMTKQLIRDNWACQKGGPERLREKDAGRRRPLHRCRDGRRAGSFPHQLEGGTGMSEEKLTRAAVVTGGSRGIGRAVCVALAKQGCNVVVNYCHGEAAAAETAALCKELGVEAVTVQADVSTAEGCKKLFEEAVNAFGRVDILVNNAGVTRDNLILRLSEEDFDTVLNANLKGAFLCCKEAARRMVRQRYGRIVNLSSVVGLRGNAGQTNYSASKAGLIGLTKSLAKELASRNVTVNAVAPGFIATDMTAALPEAVRTEMCKTIPD